MERNKRYIIVVGLIMKQGCFFLVQVTVYWITHSGLIVNIKTMIMEMFVRCLPCKRQDAKLFRCIIVFNLKTTP